MLYVTCFLTSGLRLEALCYLYFRSLTHAVEVEQDRKTIFIAGHYICYYASQPGCICMYVWM